ncbi:MULTISPECIES: hypothetical protein [Rodentibacter]|uniref:Uncharacterized protein n=1 Tax=Rodentibacter pneumotropicus TaxID=758 RepID=A0A4S2PYJ1_9PAST|nr:MULTISPECIES: hypothetical protein [Pasteurellaceae]TGY50802.1 hypothetical protein E5343_00150 [Pasteurella caecimuris]THA00971.1 hypothetical protein D3M74_06490 [Rodentibacter pneumotropicus]THA08169.1 hypothetical protein D3M78_08120 [Rodentibacter pneumotropicus]THA09140.1 hypothetical protein D3M77_02875 [Rodentibacter pneumotropicus]THA17266.1 hypothetical protein D3M76_01960 [Rodentibacter pneumotropicus]
MARKVQIYAAYKGDINLGDGTAEELSKKFGVLPSTIANMSTPRYLKRDKSGNRLIFIKLDKEELSNARTHY